MSREKIKYNLETIKEDLNPGITLVAVTKTVGLEEVKILKNLGVNDFGENRITDAEEKIKNIKAIWNMIGHLQSNKVKKAVELFDVIQSVDSVELAEKIDKESERQNKKVRILLQVNIAKEPQKSGFDEIELEEAIETISRLKNIILEGFMMIAPNIEPEKTRKYFKQMKILFDKNKQQYNLKTLSMGMSNDYKVAVEEGSNMVRVGTKLFE